MDEQTTQWEEEFDYEFGCLYTPAIKAHFKSYIHSLLSAKTGRQPGFRELEEEALVKAAQKFCRETYDMTGEKEEYHEKFGVLICFIKDILVPSFARPVVGVKSDTKFINHIKSHLLDEQEVVCKICGKTAKEICHE